MIREHLFHKRAAADPLFRWRGGEVSRLEGFSDGVFALTLTLLVVSGSAPATFYELFQTVRDLPVFLVSFALLMMAWYYHYLFFRRYGLEDFITTILNAAFLFLILFFAYPLRFLASFLWKLILGEPTGVLFEVPKGIDFPLVFQREWMMYFYGFGLIGVFGLLGIMLLRAYTKREELELDRLEVHLTRTGMGHHLITVTVASASVLCLVCGLQPGTAGVIYFLLWPLHMAMGFWGSHRADRLHQEITGGRGEGT